MYHGVGELPRCAPQEVIDQAKRECSQQIKGLGLTGAWADQDPCGVAQLPPCLTFTPFTFAEPGEEPPPVEEEEAPSGAFYIGGILLLLLAAGGGYYIYRRARRKGKL